jgi:uncharacterized protein YrrD
MRSVLGHEVVGVDSAESLGSVKHFVVSRRGDRIERLHVDGRGKHADFVAWDDLDSFGGDRVMVARSSATDTSDDPRDVDAAKGNVDVLGARILDTAGFERGRVDDVSFDSDDGTIVAVHTTEGTTIEADAVRSFGSYALVVDR